MRRDKRSWIYCVAGVALTLSVLCGPVTASTSDGFSELSFDGSRTETERLIGYYQSIQLSEEEEALRFAALKPLPAPCCNEFSAATCCCECNLSRATWGLSKYLITVLGYGEEDVREAVVRYHEAISPEGGFPGNSCMTGGCGRAFRDGGCGGMQAHDLAH